VVAKLRGVQNPSQLLKFRLRVLDTQGLATNHDLRKVKAAWEAYLDTAFGIGLFDDPHGLDLRSRLTSSQDDDFRSAMAEYMAAWYLAGKLRLTLQPRPPGRRNRVLEFRVTNTEIAINVEVKAPHREITNDFWWGNDSDLFQQALETANKQFPDDVANLLVLAPQIRIPVYSQRTQLIRAFLGELVISIPIDTRSGGPAGPERNVFKPSGHFVKKHGATLSKVDGIPRFTRVSAVLSIEETAGAYSIEHQTFLLHNPYAKMPISEKPWEVMPQLVLRDGKILWTDGAPVWP